MWGVFIKGNEIHVAPADPTNGKCLGHILDELCLCDPKKDGKVIIHREN